MTIKGNKGEWSEIYVFFKLLETVSYMLPMPIFKRFPIFILK